MSVKMATINTLFSKPYIIETQRRDFLSKETVNNGDFFFSD